jgi:hypothetical protein
MPIGFKAMMHLESDLWTVLGSLGPALGSAALAMTFFALDGFGAFSRAEPEGAAHGGNAGSWGVFYALAHYALALCVWVCLPLPP